MCKCFGRVGENREGMEAMRLQQVNFNPRSGAARHIALHELLGTQYACQEDHFELQQTAENIS